MNNKYLPIGSIVLLKGAKKKLMIIGLLQKNKAQNKEYDYTACLYPIGVYDSNKLISFNHDDIDIVYGYGYMDEDYFKMNDSALKQQCEKFA